MLKWLRPLWVQVLLAMLIGIALGAFAPNVGAQMKPFGDGFISLVKMIIAPVIFVTVVHGIASMSDMRKARRVALKALIYFEIVTTLALVIGLTAVNLWKPGVGMNIDPASLDASSVSQYATAAKHQNATEFFLGIIPETFVSAFTHSSVLQVLFVSILFACALVGAGEKGKPVLKLIEDLAGIIFKIVHYIMYAAPLGAFGAIAFTVGKFGAGSLAALGGLIVEFYVVCFVFVFVVLGGIAAMVGVNLIRLLGYIREEIVIVAATTTSETVLPRLIEKLKKLGCEETVVGLVVPTGYTFNLDGTCLYLTTAIVFLAQATNTPLDFYQQMTLLAVLLLTSKGSAAVAGAAFVVLAATLATSHAVPLVSIALILGIHRILAEALTFVNLVGNTLATIVVAKWEKAVDEKTLYEAVGFRRRVSAPKLEPEGGLAPASRLIPGATGQGQSPER